MIGDEAIAGKSTRGSDDQKSEPLNPLDPVFKGHPLQDISIAIMLILLIVGVEFSFRRGGLLFMPTVVSFGFLDMVFLGAGYVIICGGALLVIQPNTRQKSGYTGFRFSDQVQQKVWVITVLVISLLGARVVSVVD